MYSGNRTIILSFYYHNKGLSSEGSEYTYAKPARSAVSILQICIRRLRTE